MKQDDGELERALRTAKRSLSSAEAVAGKPEEATAILFGAVHQLVFLVEKLLEERATLRLRGLL